LERRDSQENERDSGYEDYDMGDNADPPCMEEQMEESEQ